MPWPRCWPGWIAGGKVIGYERRAGPPQASSLPHGGTGRRPKGAPMSLLIRDLGKRYGDSPVFSNVSLEVAPGASQATGVRCGMLRSQVIWRLASWRVA